MPLPASVTTVPVHIKISSPVDGTPGKGRVLFVGSYALRDTSDNVIMGPPSIPAVLDDNGEATVSLIATNDPDISPSGWAYTVYVATDVWRPDPWQIQIPYDTVGTLELADVAPAVSPQSVVTYALDSAVVHRDVATTKGDLLAATGPGAITRLGVGADGLVLTADSTAGTGVSWQPGGGGGGGGGTPSSTVTSETSYGQAAAAGAATTYSRGDHTHGTPALASTAASSSAVGDTATAGTATAPARADHVHGRENFGTVSPQTSFGQVSSSGTATTPARSDHVHGTPAAPTLAGLGGVPATRQVATGTGLSGGGDLTADRTLSVTPDSTNQQLRISAAGVLVGTRREVNLIQGSGVTLTVADNAGANRVDVTVSAAGGGGGFGQSRDAAMLGLQAVTMPWQAAVQGSNGEVLPSGTVVWQLWRPGAVTISNLGTWLTAAGVTSSGVNGMALADAAGNLIDQTVDMTALFSGTLGYIEAALSGGSRTLSDVNYYVGVLTHFSGSAPRAAGSTLTGNPPAFKTTPPCVVVTGQGGFASFNPNTATKNNGSYFMAAS